MTGSSILMVSVGKPWLSFRSPAQARISVSISRQETEQARRLTIWNYLRIWSAQRVTLNQFPYPSPCPENLIHLDIEHFQPVRDSLQNLQQAQLL